jgi:hypothetical protein
MQTAYVHETHGLVFEEQRGRFLTKRYVHNEFRALKVRSLIRGE